MQTSWAQHWMQHAELLAKQSPCSRGKVGALIIDTRNNIISTGFNGPPRKAPGIYCAGSVCVRNEQNIKSGTHTELGCHHAEQNAICNAAYKGIALYKSWLIVSVAPCLGCARVVHHAGISGVVCKINYDRRGIQYLRKHGVEDITL